MNKTFYQKPICKAIELIEENMIATSGDAGGTVNPMPVGSNKRDFGENIWTSSDKENHSIWK